MTDAPKEIYYDPRDGYISGSVPPEHPAFAHCVAYIRADLTPSPEVVKELVEALRKLHHAVCGETGFAACVRMDSGKAYPWPALDEADAAARAILARLEGGE